MGTLIINNIDADLLIKQREILIDMLFLSGITKEMKDTLEGIIQMLNEFADEHDEHIKNEFIRLCFLHQENGTCDDCLKREEEGCKAFD